MSLGSRFLRLFILCIVISCLACSKYEFPDYESCTIYRDQWGVPHIYGRTDKDVAYGLAWASCEDDFKTVQEQMLAIKGLLGRIKGKDGVIADFGIRFMGLRHYAQENYHLIDSEVQGIISSYADGLNAFAKTHPEEVLLNAAFPILPSDIVAGYMLGLVEISGAGSDLQKILSGEINKEVHNNFPKGSNAIALSKRITEEHQTFLAINSHQPMEGWYSWYEAHLISDEGMNILGGTFPGGVTIFHGVNEHLGWAHTVNEGDFSDVFKLEMHPTRKNLYKFDNQWRKLNKKVIWEWVKLWKFVRIPLRRVMYESVYGNTFKSDQGYFAWRFVAGEAIHAIEQWYRMNKANSWKDFRQALDIQGIPCTNIVYADREDNIFYISNGRFPGRSVHYDWKEVVPGIGKESMWQEPYYTIDDLPQVLNPGSGYVFNTNNTPYSSSDSLNNPPVSNNQLSMGFPGPGLENSRSRRFLELIGKEEKWSYEEFKKLKFDQSYPSEMAHMKYGGIDLLLQLNPEDYPDIKEQIVQLNQWDRNAGVNSPDAALFVLSRRELLRLLSRDEKKEKRPRATEALCAEAIRIARDEMIRDYGSTQIVLGQIQRHSRAGVDLAISGAPDVLAAIYSRKQEDGRYRAFSGESYIEMIRFDSLTGPIIESVHAYGASAEPDSPHYTDQMEIFTNHRMKSMSLNLQIVKEGAVDSYHPLKILRK